MTNGWIDIKNTDMMLIMGGNPAECHPCGFKWPIEAKLQRNAKLIVVDPRFTRTAANADLFLQIRPGSDIAFLGGMINYALAHGRIAHDYLVNYTNAAFIVKDGFKLPEDGLFSGFDSENHGYDKSTWNYEQGGNLTGAGAAATPVTPPPSPVPPNAGGGRAASGNALPVDTRALTGLGYAAQGPAGAKGGGGGATSEHRPSTPAILPANVAYDMSLQHPRCVYQLLARQYSRYTPEIVERITGIPKDQFLKAADLFTSIRKDGDMKKVATIIYAVGWTQHSSGTQIIRTAAILQLLLGDIGRAGGGMNALRGHSNIQGATDLAGIFDILPGYLKMPAPDDVDIATYLKRSTPTSSKPPEWDSFNYWSNTPKFAVSFLKAMYGDAARKDNDWAFHYLPKIDRNYSWVEIWDGLYTGRVKGLMTFGMNGVQIGPNSKKNIDALKKADWLVVGELYPDETSEFWRAPGTTPEEMKSIQTTVFRLPCAGFAEKDGTFVNSARWLQWKNAAVPPPGLARLDQDILAQIFLKIRDLYRKDGGVFPDPVLKVSWPYTQPDRPSLAEVAREISGQALADITDPSGLQIKAGQQLPGFAALKDDGTTLSGNWLYCGSWTEAGNQAARRNTDDPSGPRHLSAMGVVVAREPARHVQPCVLRSGRESVGPGATAGVVGPGQRPLGRQRRPRLQDRFEARRSHGAVHHEPRGRRPHLRAARGVRRRTVP